MKLPRCVPDFVVVLTLLSFGLSSTPSARAVAWVARHGLTGAQYQSEFNQWTGQPYFLRPICVSGYEEGGQARYAAIWAKQAGSWIAVHGASEADFVTQVNTLRNQGWRPTYLCAFGAGGQALFNGIFEPTGNNDIVFQPSLTWTEYTSVSTTLTSQGYRLIEICPFNVGTQDFYAGLWEKPRGIFVSQILFHHRETAAQYQTTFTDLTGQGWRLVGVRGFSISGQTRFTSHWEKPAASDWWSFHGLTPANYQGETWNAVYQGYRPTFVDAYTEGGATRFAGMWYRNGGFPVGTIGQIDSAARTYMQQNAVPGLTVAISWQGRLVFAKGYGYADQAAGETVHPLNRFRIASVSKPFCATAMLKLVDENSVELTNKVFGSGALLGTTYGNGTYSTREKQILVRHLLSHTTGWPDPADSPIWDNANGDNTAAVIGQVLDNYEPSFIPGNQYNYVNVDFCTAGRIIEKQTGKTFQQYVKDAILAPCGITDMEIGNQTKAGRKPNEVVYCDSSRDPYVDINPHRMDANGGWIATAMDLLLFGRRIDGKSLQKDVISADSITAMRTGSGSNPTYGLGWFWDGGQSWFGHNGCMTGTLGWLITRQDDIHIAAMTNYRPGADSCGSTFGGVLLGICNTLKTANLWPDIDLFPSSNPGYDKWASAHFSASALANLSLRELIWAPEADPDGDGEPNIQEAYLNHDPLVANPDFRGLALSSRSDFIYRWLRSTDTHGVEEHVLWSPALSGGADWSATEIAPTRGVLAPVGYQWMDATLPRSGKPTAFMRLDLTLP